MEEVFMDIRIVGDYRIDENHFENLICFSQLYLIHIAILHLVHFDDFFI